MAHSPLSKKLLEHPRHTQKLNCLNNRRSCWRHLFGIARTAAFSNHVPGNEAFALFATKYIVLVNVPLTMKMNEKAAQWIH